MDSKEDQHKETDPLRRVKETVSATVHQAESGLPKTCDGPPAHSKETGAMAGVRNKKNACPPPLASPNHLVPRTTSGSDAAENPERSETSNQEGIQETEALIPRPRLYDATVRHIFSPNRVEILVHTDFRVSFTHFCELVGVPIPDLEIYDRARHAFILIAGGKPVLVETEPDAKVSNPYLTPIYIYRRGSLPRDCRDCAVTAGEVEYINVNRYLVWLSERGYPIETVKKHRKGFKN